MGDGYYGWPEVEGGFDIVIVTCAAQYAPPDLFKQMKPGGRMVIPIGQPFKRGQVLYVYTKDEAGKIHSRRDMGVFFIPMTGAMMQLPRPAQGATAPHPAIEPRSRRRRSEVRARVHLSRALRVGPRRADRGRRALATG